MAGSERPRAVGVDPYRFEDDTWLGPPSSIEDRAHPGNPQESSAFWDGLVEDRIVFQRCTACRHYTHYPVGGCEWCGSATEPEEVDGAAVVNTWTLSLLEFGPGMETPYVTAIVNPDCEPAIQLMTNLVNVRVSDIRIGIRVRPLIVHDSSRALLLYEPAEEAER